MKQIDSIFEIEDSIPLIRRLFFGKWKNQSYVDRYRRRELEARNKAIVQEIKVR